MDMIVDPKLRGELWKKFEEYMKARGLESYTLGDVASHGFDFACEQVIGYAKMEKCAYCGASRPRDPTSPTNGYCARCRENSHHALEFRLREANSLCDQTLKFLGSVGLSNTGAARGLASFLKKKTED